MIPLPGWGQYRWTSVSPVDSAQFYFDQGINMYYSFHIVEALSSFQKAAYLDPASAMAYWGIALAYGPNINDVAYNYSPLALKAARKADSLSKSLGAFEKGIIRAMLARYSDNAAIPRINLDEAYAREMKKVFDQFPGNPDAGALYADALMLLHPWDLYDQRQKPKAWTPELVATIEKVLSTAPNHPGANHYYIHAVEASTDPGRALSSADKLGTLLPSVAHMVHMPSHIYIRTGMYEKGNRVNKMAIDGYRRYRQLMPAVEMGAFIYLFHNIHMQATCALGNGTYQEAIAASELLQQELPMEYLGGAPPEAEYLQYMYMTKMFTEIRFGKWDKILQTPGLPDSLLYAGILREFGRSLAFSRQKRFQESVQAIRQMEQILDSSERLKKRMGAFNTAYAGGEVAIALAKGILAEEQQKYPEAVGWLEKAVALEDGMVYDEPKDWLLPPRQYLGAALLKSGNYSKAEIIFREDLGFNPNNGWSLKGLEMALKAQNKGDAWKKAEMESRQSRENKDFNPNGPVF
jgi:tetratricopeptide (TPR) repeat protein